MNSSHTLENIKLQSLRSLPNRIKRSGRFVIFEVVKRPGDKPAKRLLPGKRGYRSWSGPKHAGNTYEYAEVVSQVGRNPQLSAGLILDSVDLISIDIDHACDERGNLDPGVETLLRQTNCYLERSLSGRGFHLLFDAGQAGSIPRVEHPTRHGDLIEPCEGLLAVTGDLVDRRSRIGTPEELVQAVDLIGQIWTTARPALQPSQQPPCRPANMTSAEVRRLLERIPARFFVDYGCWLKIGMAIHDAIPNAEGLNLWDELSLMKAPDKYEEGICDAKWKSFK